MELRRVLDRFKPLSSERDRFPRLDRERLEEAESTLAVSSSSASSKLHSREGNASSLETSNSADISKEKADAAGESMVDRLTRLLLIILRASVADMIDCWLFS